MIGYIDKNLKKMLAIFFCFFLPVSCISDQNDNARFHWKVIKDELQKKNPKLAGYYLLDSIIAFYKKEIPYQYSSAVYLSNTDNNPVMLNGIKYSEVDSFDNNSRIIMYEFKYYYI